MKLLDRGRERKKRAFTPSIAAAAATSTSFWECWCRRIFSCKRCNLNSTQLRYACENNFSKWLPLSRNRRCRRRRSCLPSWWADASEQKKTEQKSFVLESWGISVISFVLLCRIISCFFYPAISRDMVSTVSHIPKVSCYFRVIYFYFKIRTLAHIL